MYVSYSLIYINFIAIINFVSFILDCPFQSVSILNIPRIKISVGKLAVLVCRVSGMAVEWWRNDVNVTDLATRLNHNKESFYIAPTSSPHSAVYTCKVIDHVENVKCTKSANVTVIVTQK